MCRFIGAGGIQRGEVLLGSRLERPERRNILRIEQDLLNLGCCVSMFKKIFATGHIGCIFTVGKQSFGLSPDENKRWVDQGQR